MQASLNSEEAALRRLLAEDRLRILYMAPERLRPQVVGQLLQDGGLTQGNLWPSPFDEAHCISVWGHGFQLY